VRVVSALALVLCGATSTSCINGLVFHHTVMPLTTNFQATPAVGKTAAGDTKHLQISYANILWESNGIGDIAKQMGMNEVDYADLERFSILGIWTQEWVHVYGR
jgi:hypothetical protein